MKLHKYSAIDFGLFFCKELTIVVVARKMRVIKLLVAID